MNRDLATVVADLLQDVRIEPLGEKQDALPRKRDVPLLAQGIEESALTGICKNRLVAAAPAAKTGETSMEVSAFKILVEHPGYGAHHLTDDPAPGTVLLLVALVVDALELLVIVFHQCKERTGSRIARLVNGSGRGLHALHNS
jgi:hypothetical protein